MHKYIIYQKYSTGHDCPISTKKWFKISLDDSKTITIYTDEYILYGLYSFDTKYNLEITIMWNNKMCIHTISNYLLIPIQSI
jgi:hypothetical protein